MRLAPALSGFLIVMTLALGFGSAEAADTDWLVGYWQGHNARKPSDTRHFVLDIAAVNADRSFTAGWGIDGKQGVGRGKIDDNAITIEFPNGNSVSLFRASDGTLAGSIENKDGSPGATLVFAKDGTTPAIAAPPSDSGRGCQYRSPSPGGGGAATLQAKDGEEVVARLGRFRCVDGKLQRLD
ncbi:MAG TPA: hypothetical protein VGF92_02740 [Stellaceae bacterium]|jgi:hypothetical protein